MKCWVVDSGAGAAAAADERLATSATEVRFDIELSPGGISLAASELVMPGFSCSQNIVPHVVRTIK